MKNENVRDNYLNNHKEWFLKYHQVSVESFEKQVESNYNSKKVYDVPPLFNDV
jgi:hypothetical protein